MGLNVVTMAGVSLIATVKDEIDSIQGWLTGIEGQTCMPDEVVVVDGGSTDGTWEVLSLWRPEMPIQLLRVPGTSISAGRNEAIAVARHPLVAVTDAGTIADSKWLERLVEALSVDDIDVASGFFVPALNSRWARSLAAATLPEVSEVREVKFQPSSRSVAFRRQWWERGIRYPEWLDYCEDLVWDLALRRAGARFRFVPSAVVEFSVRPALIGYLRQYFRYARGDGKAGLFGSRHALRYLTYGGLVVVMRRRRTREIMGAAMLGALYARRPILRLVSRDRRAGVPLPESALAAPATIALRGAGDIAKMAGYPFGLVWRLRHFGTGGSRSTWKRVTPTGARFRPSELSRENRRPTS